MSQRFSGVRLRAARESQGQSREWLALQVRRSHNSIVQYELDRADPPVEVIVAAADALGCDVGDLFEVAP